MEIIKRDIQRYQEDIIIEIDVPIINNKITLLNNNKITLLNNNTEIQFDIHKSNNKIIYNRYLIIILIILIILIMTIMTIIMF
jgi:ribosomal protein L24